MELADSIKELLKDEKNLDMLKSMASNLFAENETKPTDGGLNFNPTDISQIMKLKDSLTCRKDDDRVALIKALMPYLSPEKRDKAETAVKLLRLYSLLPVLRECNLLKEFI